MNYFQLIQSVPKFNIMVKLKKIFVEVLFAIFVRPRTKIKKFIRKFIRKLAS